MYDIMREVEADSRNVIRHATFGHLYPEDNDIHVGQIIACRSAYGDFIVIDESVEGIEDSPWWYESMDQFVYDALKDEDVGVWAFQVSAQSVPDPTEWDDEEGKWVESTISKIYITEVSRNKIEVMG